MNHERYQRPIKHEILTPPNYDIFDQFEKSDYFVFIDFKRENLSSKPAVHRGSLFSNQELAIASFLEIPAVILHEFKSRPEFRTANASAEWGIKARAFLEPARF